VVDLAIAANFVRELTEDQFAEQQQRPRRRNAAASPATKGSEPARPEYRRGESTRMGRTLARLAQVRG
jgi:hypothetical protein